MFFEKCGLEKKVNLMGAGETAPDIEYLCLFPKLFYVPAPIRVEITHSYLFNSNRILIPKDTLMSVLRTCLLIFLLFPASPPGSGAQQYSLQPEDLRLSTVPAGDTNALLAAMDKAAFLEAAQPDHAIARYHALLHASLDAGFVAGVNRTLNRLGNLYAGRGRYDLSEQDYQSALAACARRQALWPCLPTVYNGLGTIRETQSRYREAATFYHKAVWLAERLGVPSTGGVYNNLGAVLISLDQFHEALHYLDIAEERAIASRNYSTLGMIYTNKGLVYYAEKQWNKSEHYHRAAMKLSREHQLPQTEHESLTGLGILYLGLGRPAEALHYLLQANKVPGNFSLHYRNNNFENIGKAYQALGKYREAEKYLLLARSTAAQLQLGKKVAENDLLLSQIYEAENKPARALEHYKAYTSLRDSFAGQEVITDVQQLNIRFKTAEKDKDIAQKQLLIARQEDILKQKNTWITLIAVGALLISGLFVSLYRNARHRQLLQARQLQILQQEQEINQLRAMMQGEEKERARIAQELHDGIGGMLAAIKMNFSTLRHHLAEGSPVRDLREISGMLDETSHEVRKMAHNLMPDTLLQHGLSETLKAYCEKINAGDQVYVNVQINAGLQKLSPPFTLALYRIIQELLQNVLKHADAGNVLVLLDEQQEKLKLCIKDNGRGFVVGRQQEGLGLQNVQSRISAFQGQLNIQSDPAKGTLVTALFDLDKIKA